MPLHSQLAPPDRRNSSIKCPKCTPIQKASNGPREHLIPPQPTHNSPNTRHHVPHGAHSSDARRAAERRVHRMQAIVDAPGQLCQRRARLAERVPLGRELARPRLEPRDLRLQLPALGLLLREGVPARLELCAGGGKLALKPAHRVAVVIQVVRHHLHVGRGDPERDDGYEKHRYHRLPARQ